MRELSLKLQASSSISGSVNSPTKLTGGIGTNSNITGHVAIGSVIRDTNDIYLGEYEVTPSTKSQTLDTKNKIMANDITINSIPYAEVTNTANGTTVTIG